MKQLPKTIEMQKRVGETPLAALERLRKERPELVGIKLAYAGRLDPMASGKLLVIVGEECKNLKAYLGLDKEYVVEVLFGVESDTGDVLGIVKGGKDAPVDKKAVAQALKKFVGEISMPYPAYSSKPVHGKPLFQWALEERLGEIEVPVRDSRIYRAKVNSLRTLSGEELEREVYARIAALPKVTEASKELGRDFRRSDVLSSWDKVLREKEREYAIAQITVKCSSGTYMRSLAQLLAKEIGTSGLALSIIRTKIGKRFWWFV